MPSLHRCVSALLLLYIITGISCEKLTPVQEEESGSEDRTVTLSYKYHKAATGTDYFFWYRQYSGKPPEFLISHSGTGTVSNNPMSGLSVNVSEDKTRMDLQISSAAVTDSALYYCAVKPATNWKIIFGEGTKVIIEGKEEYKPSYYKVESGDTKACLATGFSGRGVHKNDTLFNWTEPARISKDSLYNQVALLSSKEDEELCENAEDESEPCDESGEQDSALNLVSLTVLGLRLIFLKTIVFNVLMTFRLWTSQCECERTLVFERLLREVTGHWSQFQK